MSATDSHDRTCATCGRSATSHATFSRSHAFVTRPVQSEPKAAKA